MHNVEVLRKLVLLFIAGLEINLEEFVVLQAMYMISQQPMMPEIQFKIVWIPVVNKSTPWNAEKQNLLETIQAKALPLWYFRYQKRNSLAFMEGWIFSGCESSHTLHEVLRKLLTFRWRCFT